VLVGKEKKESMRLIIDIVPEQEYEERIRKVNKSNKERGWATSEGHKARCRFNLFITNVQAEDLSADDAVLIYRLRWQVELMFKNWKSVCKIDKIKPLKYERFACLLFAKLILILLKMQIIGNLQVYYFKKEKKILSGNKCFKTLQGSFGNLRGIWQKSKKGSEKELLNLGKQFSSNHWIEKRKDKMGFLELVGLLICKSKKYEYI
jgi:transposase